MAVLTAFCDETGTDQGKRLTCVGGYVFDADGRERFNRRWASVLEPLRPRGIRYFHAVDCNEPNHPFTNLSFAERQALFGDLIALVRVTAKFGMVAGIEDHVFQEVMRRNKVQSFTGTKYTACAIRSLVMLGHWADENNYEGGIQYLFESGDESQQEADLMMKQIAEDPKLTKRYRYAGHCFHPKCSLLPLQAADLLVWLWQRACAESKYGPYLKNLFRRPSVPHYVAHISDTSLNVIAMVNMFYGIRSNRMYEEQDGEIRKYTI